MRDERMRKCEESAAQQFEYLIVSGERRQTLDIFTHRCYYSVSNKGAGHEWKPAPSSLSVEVVR